MASTDEDKPQQTEEVLGEENPHHENVTDSEGEDEFVKKYGEIKFQYIKKPKDAVWFTRPHALNYFKDNVLYRTKGERLSGKIELFLDLIYVGIIANVAGDACENASWQALVKYILVFIPYWTVWADIKDFTNYYYNEDLSQKLYLLWILVLLVTSVNSQSKVLELRKAAAFTIVPYILCRVSLAISLLFYSLFVPEHRPQQRLYSVFLFITSCVWIPVIFVDTTAKIIISAVAIALEQLTFCIVFHPITKRILKITTSTALNIEHEVDRMAAFYTVAIGEFLTKISAELPIGVGFTSIYPRGILYLIIAYIIFWLYDRAGTSRKAVHPLRHSAFRAVTWIYLHLVLIGSVVLAADAGGDLLSLEDHSVKKKTHVLEESGEEINAYALMLFFTGGLCVTLLAITAIGALEAPRDTPGTFRVPKFWRIIFRVPIAFIILGVGFLNCKISEIMGLIVLVLGVLYIYESIVCTPKHEKRPKKTTDEVRDLTE